MKKIKTNHIDESKQRHEICIDENGECCGLALLPELDDSKNYTELSVDDDYHLVHQKY